MTAVYPNAIAIFTTKVDDLTIVDATDVNRLQDEVSALESVLGLNPQVPAVGSTFATVKARLDHVDTSFAPVVHTHPFALPTSSNPGDVASVGGATTFAQSDHLHGREVFGSPGNSAVGDVASSGVAITLARADHVHGREAFGTNISPVSVSGSSPGVATTPASSDHQHQAPGRVALLIGNQATQYSNSSSWVQLATLTGSTSAAHFYRITFSGAFSATGTDGADALISVDILVDGSSLLEGGRSIVSSGGGSTNAVGEVAVIGAMYTPNTSGTHTFACNFSSSGSTIFAQANVIYFLVEDIG